MVDRTADGRVTTRCLLLACCFALGQAMPGRSQTVPASPVIGIGNLVAAAQSPGPRFVTAYDLLKGSKELSSWLMFAGDYNGQRHTRADQLTPQNVNQLAPQWMLQTEVQGFPGRGIETTPLVVDGIMYATANGNQAWAIDARTGQRLWSYERRLPDNFAASVCCGPVNRGLAVLGNRLYMGTLDGSLIALDRTFGTVVWQTKVGDLKNANPITMAPLIVKDKVIVGVAGSDFATRGYLRRPPALSSGSY